MRIDQQFICHHLDDTANAGQQIAQRLSFPACVYLQGDLGAGKTTLSSAIIQSFGYQGAVTSPTYNLMQEYPVDQGVIYHLDLYRLEDAEELEFLAIKDLMNANTLFLIEWPQKGEPLVPPATHQLVIKVSDQGVRQIQFTN